jgi:glycyl-tRNA synthetase
MPSEKAPDPVMFQTIMMALQEYWAKQGCLIWQPYYTQVGAGTNNPATFLRVLGPEPWNVGYVEPSVRPDDGRYGENPNRFQLHYQFQVILKPDPGNPQELYLDSLKAIGIDPREHDIRFVEDNWEQPTIAAWGLGWEVWLDGQEITQFTYFQQVGGQTLDPVAVEITYGLDRILIALNNASAIWNEPWGAGVSYGELRQQEEFEHSKYYFEVADVERVRQIFNLFEQEADACLQQGLVLPAYDYVLKCSHAFNVLDCRGAIGVTERQAFFGRVRDLARRAAAAYLEQRQRLEYPLLEYKRGLKNDQTARVKPDEKMSSLPGTVSAQEPDVPQSFLFEIGTEELPAGDLVAALEQLRQRLPEMLAELRLAHGEVRVLGTPRRLVVAVSDLASCQFDEEQVFKGPPADRAYDALGQPTKAAEGFARSKGVTVADLQVREIDGGRYVAAVVKTVGKPALDVLPEALKALAEGIKFERSMRWNQTNVPFSRPVRWLLALYGKTVIPCEFAGLRAGNLTRGLRPFDSPELVVPEASRYFDVIRQAGILLETEERKNAIVNQVQALAVQTGGEAVIDPGLLTEVANLVESPTAVLGSFDSEYLSLPEEVLISVMKKHQRYFPLRKPAADGGVAKAQGVLMPHFIVIRNGDSLHIDIVRQGNEHVLGARFADANFFVRDDLKQRLEEFVPRLNTLMFQTKLGSMLEKTRRVAVITGELAPTIGLPAEEIPVAQRAADLCKADLATRMVVEMTSLQGVMGRFYALRSSEEPAVAQAIYEHYLPRFAGDAVPASMAGLAVGLADRLDSLAGLFAVGLAPSGNKDPFGQRRTALGLVQNLIYWNLDLDILSGLEIAAVQQPVTVDIAVLQATLQFVIERLRNLLLDGGARFDHVDAVLAVQGRNPARAARAVNELVKWTKRPDWNMILPAYARCVRITRPVGEAYAVVPEAFVEPAEQALWASLRTAEAVKRAPGSVDAFLTAFLPMIPAISTFFDAILVMAPELEIRQNRLGLLQRIAGLAEGVADFSRLEGF